MRDYFERRERELEARVVELERALAPFSMAADRYVDRPGSKTHDNVQLWQDGRRIDFLTVGDLRQAQVAYLRRQNP
jgi:hypothetical protein